MSLLNAKLLRDIRQARGQFFLICLLVALGVALFEAALAAYLNQRASYERSYDRLAFADVSVAVERMPRAAARRLAQLPGVRAVEGRLVIDLEVRQREGRRRRVVGRLVTVPAGREPAVNRLRLVAGRPLSFPPRREVLLEQSFAREHGYAPGDHLYPVLAGEEVPFTVVGIVNSAEYIYAVPSKQFLLPTPETFGVLFIPQQEAEALTGMAGMVNEVVLRTDPGRAGPVGSAVARRLRAYGPQDPVPRAEQPSNKVLQSDLEGWKPFMVLMPGLFLGAAALMVAQVLARWVQTQRPVIGFLRASGFAPPALLRHYAALGLLAGVLGGLPGIGLGYLLSLWLSGIYAQTLQMPYVVRGLHPQVAALAFALALAAGAAGALGPALQAAAIAPAEAMRGQLPGRGIRLPRVKLPLLLALPLRNLLRQPLRTVGSLTGLALAVTVLILSGAFMDSMAATTRVYLDEIQRYDVLVGFTPVRSEAFLAHVRRWPGVLRAEPTLEIPVRVLHRGRQKETVAIGVPPGSRLRRLPGPGGGRLMVHPDTVLLSDDLARRLEVEAGSIVRLEYTQNTRARHAAAEFHAGRPVRQPIGLPVYLPLAELRRRFAAPLGLPPDAVSGALLEVDPAYLRSIRDRLERQDGISLVQTKAELTAQVNQLTEIGRTFIWAMFLMGAAMAFAVTYTTTDIALWERTRELGTLRALGFGVGRIARVVTAETLLVALLGALAGLLPGYWIAFTLIEAMTENEGFTLRLTVAPRTYVLAAGSILLAALLAQWPGLRRIRHLNLAAAIRLRHE